ncbi:MAG: HAMP domain-containing protein [Treponema sp.]|jgi:HPt (histidine-containing phosphotransfer) domain-containing protein|nr:HAMP domain-containing protein [Treponema sp.]
MSIKNSIRGKALFLVVLLFLVLNVGFFLLNLGEFRGVSPVLPAGAIIFSLLVIYLIWGISDPLKQLTRSSEELAAGNMDVFLEPCKRKDELGLLTKSLIRVAEQFRTDRIVQRRYQDRFETLLGIHYALYRTDSLEEAFNSLLTAVAEYFEVFKAALVLIMDASPKLAAAYPLSFGEGKKDEFTGHGQAAKLLGDRKHLTMNRGTLQNAGLSFVDEQTQSLCVLALRTEGVLRGYVILEGKKEEAFIHDDTTLLFIGDTLAYLLDHRWRQEKPAPRARDFSGEEESGGSGAPPESPLAGLGALSPEEAGPLLVKARTIPGLNVDRGLSLVGGEEEQYAELLRVTVGSIAQGIQKTRNLHVSDLAAFAVEIHGMKSALYTIGADSLGDEARQLEFSAKSDDAAYCGENYPDFEERLRGFSRNLAALFPSRESPSQRGDPKELAKTLEQVQKVCGDFDAAGAAALLAPMNVWVWEGEIGKNLEALKKDLDNIEYDDAMEKISTLLEAAGRAGEGSRP